MIAFEPRASFAFLSDQLEKILDRESQLTPSRVRIPTPNQYQMVSGIKVKLDGSIGNKALVERVSNSAGMECVSRDSRSLMPNGAEHHLLLKTLIFNRVQLRSSSCYRQVRVG